MHRPICATGSRGLNRRGMCSQRFVYRCMGWNAWTHWSKGILVICGQVLCSPSIWSMIRCNVCPTHTHTHTHTQTYTHTHTHAHTHTHKHTWCGGCRLRGKTMTDEIWLVQHSQIYMVRGVYRPRHRHKHRRRHRHRRIHRHRHRYRQRHRRTDIHEYTFTHTHTHTHIHSYIALTIQNSEGLYGAAVTGV